MSALAWLGHFVHALHDVLWHALGYGDIHTPLPPGMRRAVRRLKRAGNKRACLRLAYDILTRKYRGYRAETYTRFFDLFRNSLESLWARSGFLHCTGMNYLMHVLLVKSGWFAEEDIERKWTLVWYVSPHEYLRVRTGKETFVNIDLWGRSYGIRFGDYSRGFHEKTEK